VRRWVKVVLAIVVGNQTKDAERNVEGAELIDTQNGTLQVLDEGDPQDPPIVLLHGSTESMNWFEELAPLLAADHRVIRFDLLGHGGSEKPGAGYEMANQADAIAEALGQLEVTGATVVGNSLGGTVATALAEQSPDLVARIVILDQAPNEDYGELPFIAKVGQLPILGPAMQRVIDASPNSAVLDGYEEAFAPGFNIASGFENPDQPVDDLRQMTYTAFSETVDKENEYTAARSLDDRLSALEIPLLVAFGAEDQIYDPAEEAIKPYEDIDGVQTELVEGLGHSPNVEDPVRTAALIEAFIVRTEAQARAQRRAEARREARKRAARRAARAKAEAAKKRAQAAAKDGAAKDGAAKNTGKEGGQGEGAAEGSGK
jgi:pimeloyl-ACP methyl ester carboxylesterase